MIVFAILFLIPLLECHASEVIETKYYKTTYDIDGNVIENEEISESTYFSAQITPYDLSVVTEYKQLSIETSNGIVEIECNWKLTPKVQSFDVLALRGEDIVFDSNNIQGVQFYNKNGSFQYIEYSDSTINTKIFGNGVGISMNLVDDASDYKLRLSVPYSITGNKPFIYGSYQHAVRNVSLNTSQKYLLNSKGYGKVILFDNPVNTYYDAMGGVSINL